MRLTRYERPSPTNGLDDSFQTLQSEINRLFDLPWTGEPTQDFYAGWMPAVDLYEDRDNLIVKAELPGMKREEIDISVHDGSLTIAGERKSEEEKGDGDTSRSERYFGRFQRTLSLNKPLDVGKASAAYKDGILTITLPKADEAKPKQIEVKV